MTKQERRLGSKCFFSQLRLCFVDLFSMRFQDLFVAQMFVSFSHSLIRMSFTQQCKIFFVTFYYCILVDQWI